MLFFVATNRLLVRQTRKISATSGRVFLEWKRKRSNASHRQECTLKPFWRVNAVLHNVSLDLKSEALDKLVVYSEDEKVHLVVNQEHKIIDLDIHNPRPATPLHISIPYQVDLNILLKGCGNAKISNIENQSTSISADEYSIEVQNAKSHQIKVHSTKGDIVCSKMLKGNVELKAISGDIVTEKIQGNMASLTCENGSVTTGDVYAEEISIVASHKTRIRSTHGDCEIESTGDIIIGTAEGNINAITENGNIQVYLTDRVEHLDIVTNSGDIALSISAELGGQLDVEAQSINDTEAKSLNEVRQHQQGPSLRYRAELNDGGPRMSVKALGGNVTLRTSSWLDAVSLYSKAGK